MFGKINTSVLVTLLVVLGSAAPEETGTEPSVMIVLLVRNKEPYLPYTLTQLSRLDYPKRRLSLWVASDHNQDRSAQILLTWLEQYGAAYWAVEAAVNASSPPLRPDERGDAHVSAGRLRAVADMKQQALQSARRSGTDLVWFLDADVILHDRTVLRQLLSFRKPLVAPVLRSIEGHVNFQTSVDGDTCFTEDSSLSEILTGQRLGCLAVPLIRASVLVDLRDPRSEGLSFVADAGSPSHQLDDAVALALSARRVRLQATVCNQQELGLMPPPLAPSQQSSDEWRNMLDIKLKLLEERPPLPVTPLLRRFLPPPQRNRLGFDRIYVIGLERRPERWRRLKARLDELGMGVEAVRVQAVDGRKLSHALLEEHNIHPRGQGRKLHMNMGEVGCSLSHHGVWQDVVRHRLRRVLVLEDDSHPTAAFPERLRRLVDEAERLRPEWHFLYLHREAARPDDFEPVEGAEQLVRPGFSWSGMAYALTLAGAETLIRDKPLENLLCVDHYLPLMAGHVPYSQWMDVYPSAGTLQMYSGRENLIEAVVRAGEPGFVSDSTVVDGVLGGVSCGNNDKECFVAAP